MKPDCRNAKVINSGLMQECFVPGKGYVQPNWVRSSVESQVTSLSTQLTQESCLLETKMGNGKHKGSYAEVFLSYYKKIKDSCAEMCLSDILLILIHCLNTFYAQFR